MSEFTIAYLKGDNSGMISRGDGNFDANWERINSSALKLNPIAQIYQNRIVLPWYQILYLIREYIPLQKQLGFIFKTDDSSKELLNAFIETIKTTRAAREGRILTLSSNEIEAELNARGFTKRALRSFQVRDVAKLISIQSGANFSVPGAGKTTVTLAVHLLTTSETEQMLVICPKSAFTAWERIIEDCVNPGVEWAYNSGKFKSLSGSNERDIIDAFNSSQKYFYTNYEHFVSRKEVFAFVIASKKIHLVLDESHRMKAGQNSLRGSALLSIANLPRRKDILSGTPMPQGPSDLQSQLEFLWPGSDLGYLIAQGETPRNVIQGLFVRTTKDELGLPSVKRHFIKVAMSKAQGALYGIVQNEVLRQLSSFRNGNGFDIIKARHSVMRLLQLSSNPILAVRGIAEDIFLNDHAIINAIIEEPISPKVREVCNIVRKNANAGKKTVVWTIFTQNILDLENLLSDLNPVSLYGQVPSGDSLDVNTREGRLLKFHDDITSMVMIANPAAAGEGISLHTVCHDAVYLDRSYISTHYLQSIDRIHRLGLENGVETNITIVQSAPPTGLGSIDYSVSRRLAAKVRALEQLLDDPDLNQVALDEENAEMPTDYETGIDDIIDLIEELEGKKNYISSDGI
jgi:SNF2 family DNA or RNA helicase